MLLRTLWRAVAARPRHTWMALMVEECGTMPLTTIAPFVQHSFSGSTALSTSATQQPQPEQPQEAYPSAAPSSGAAGPSPPGQALGERAHAWVAVARLLCESGDWARAAAVVDGLPPPLQPAARHKALRDDWPLPRVVAEAWRRGTAAPQAKTLTEMNSSAAAGVAGVVPAVAAGSKVRSAPTASLSTPTPPTVPRRLTCHRTDELVRMAYSLRRAPSSPASDGTSSTAESLHRQQQSIIAELRSRDAIAEATQCVLNWQRRQLLRPDAETLEERGGTAAVRGEAMALFDGIGALKFMLFPSPVEQRSGSGLTSAFAAAARSGEPPHYSAGQLRHLHQAMALHPTLVARCLRDRSCGERLLRYGGDDRVAELVLAFLTLLDPTPAAVESAECGRGRPPLDSPRAIAEPAAARPRAPPIGASAAVAPLRPEAVESYWRATAALTPLLHTYYRRQHKAQKETLLLAVVRALQGSVGPQDKSRAKPSVGSALHRPSAAAAESIGRGGGGSGVTDKTRRAMKATVESVCSPLLHHEPQVRFLRLSLFGTLSLALRSVRVPIPNALAQCLLLCMADSSTPAGIPTARGGAGVEERSNEKESLPADAVTAYLTLPPAERWLPALSMLRTAQESGDYRVTPAHLRCLLSGLQSISITKTWQAALRVAADCDSGFGITPDERTLPTLLLNLKQQSWQDAFRVLRWVPSADPSNAPPTLLRDLQLVALKHASWEVPLRLMTHLQARQADGLMNYLYCVSAAGRGGQAEAAFTYFAGLRAGKGRHSGWAGVSPYNELTVAVAAVAMLDHQHYDSLHRFAQLVLALDTSGGDSKPHENGAGACATVAEAPRLTEDGRRMAQAAAVTALLLSKRDATLLDMLCNVAEEAVPSLMQCVLDLHSLTGMERLNAPVRLVFDVLGSSESDEEGHRSQGRPGQERVDHRGFLGVVSAAQLSAGTYETRQRTTVQRRRRLFVPMAHQRQRSIAVASQLGGFVQRHEAAMPPQVVRAIAETMSAAGVGPEYLKAALL